MKKQTEKSAAKKTKTDKTTQAIKPLQDKGTIHTTNPFTGEKTDITPEDLDNMEQWNEAQTERD